MVSLTFKEASVEARRLDVTAVALVSLLEHTGCESSRATFSEVIADGFGSSVVFVADALAALAIETRASLLGAEECTRLLALGAFLVLRLRF
jgi:hypothetical protein